MNPHDLPDFHPLTVIQDWNSISPGAAFRIADALTGVVCFGGTGSGKTSGPGQHLANGYLANDFGGLVLCAKPEERRQWQKWAHANGRLKDLRYFNLSAASERFNFLDWEARQNDEEGGGIAMNIVAMLDEITKAIGGGAGAASEGSGDSKFFDDALHLMNLNLVQLPVFAGLPVSLPLLDAIVNSAPQSIAEAHSEEWGKGNGICAAILRESDAATQERGDPEERADFLQCRNYWTRVFPAISEKTRSIIVLSFSMLVQPFITRPMRRLFSTHSTIKPEDTFDGTIIIADLSVQKLGLAGRVAQMVLKYCFQMAVLRRDPPEEGEYHRPVFLWWDEGQNFVTEIDLAWHAVARSAGGCSVMLVQTREALRAVLGKNDAVDGLLANLQCKFFCQNSSVDTNEFASRLIGERWVAQESFTSTGTATTSEAKRRWIEPGKFAMLLRGGPKNGFVVESICYNGGMIFTNKFPETGEVAQGPLTLLSFHQRR